MAISAPHYRCLTELHRRGLLPQGGALLEIGEAEWYGDTPVPDEIAGDVRANTDWSAAPRWQAFVVVKALYRWLFATERVVSIDWHGTPAALRADLNYPIGFKNDKQSKLLFSTVYNHGTLEHIFNPAQVFQTMHERCEVGGLLIHESPFTGWIDHGFFCIQPTLFYDVAAANKYDVVMLAVTQIEPIVCVHIKHREHLLRLALSKQLPANAMLFVALRKTADEPFKIPMQGVYAGTAGKKACAAWHALR